MAPINKISPSKRAGAAIAAIAAVASIWTAFTSSEMPAAKPGITPAIVHAAIEQGITPPAVKLAVDNLIKPWEGFSNIAYQDHIGKWTIGFGDTTINGRPVRKGDYISREDAEKRLMVRVTRDYYLPLVDGIKDFAKAPDSVQASLLSGAYNFGVKLNSSQAISVSRHQYRKACEDQTAYNRAAGKVSNGLVKRREMGDANRIGEAELCVTGIPKGVN